MKIISIFLALFFLGCCDDATQDIQAARSSVQRRGEAMTPKRIVTREYLSALAEAEKGPAERQRVTVYGGTGYYYEIDIPNDNNYRIVRFRIYRFCNEGKVFIHLDNSGTITQVLGADGNPEICDVEKK
jgi:hypothetical protein